MVLFLNFIFVNTNSYAQTDDVVITLDKHKIDYIFSQNGSNSIIISGNVTCEYDGLGEIINHVNVRLSVSDVQNWFIGVYPVFFYFDENGRKSFNLSVEIPEYTKNNTIDLMTVNGYWETEPLQTGVIGGFGSARADSVNITYFRIYTFNTTEEINSDDSSVRANEVFGWVYMIILVGIPIIIIIIIIAFIIKKLF